MIEYIKFWGAKLLFDIGVFAAVILTIIVIAALVSAYSRTKILSQLDKYQPIEGAKRGRKGK